MDMIQQPSDNINPPSAASKKKKHLVKEAPGVYSHVDQHGHKTYYVRYKHCGRAYWEKAGDTLTAAKRALTVRKSEIFRGKFSIPNEKAHTFKEIYHAYCQYIETNDKYKGALSVAKTLYEFFGDKLLKNISPFDVERYKEARKKQGIQPSTIDKEVKSVLSKMFTMAVKEKWMDSNPASAVDRLTKPGENQKERVVSPEEEHTLYQACDTMPEFTYLKPVIETLVNTGMRISECLRLRWDQVDLDNRRIYLLRTDTKGKKPRTVPINTQLAALFHSLPKVDNYVLYHQHDVKNYTKPKSDFRDLCDGLGFNDVSFHTLRHTFISRMVALGANLAVLRDIVGHADLRILSRYVHTNEGQRLDAVERLCSGSKGEYGVNGNEAALTERLLTLVG